MKRTLLLALFFCSSCVILLAQYAPKPRYVTHRTKPSASFRSDGYAYRLDSVVSFMWKELFQYNLSGSLIQYTRYDYFYSNMEFEPTERNEMILDPMGRTKTLLVSNYDRTGLKWCNNRKESNIYGSKGTLDTTLFYNWDGSAQSWVLAQKKVLVYNSKGQETKSISYNLQSNRWIPGLQVQTTLDSLDRPASVMYSLWVDSSQIWQEDYHATSFFDTIGNEVEFIGAYWNYENHAWDTAYRETYEHDERILSSQTRLPDQADWMANSRYQLRSATIYSRPGTWVENGSFVPYYSSNTNPVVTDIAQAPAFGSELSVYPNPVVDVLQVNGLPTDSQASLLDAKGNKVIDLSSDNTDVSQLPSGVYLVQVQHASGQVQKKVVKR